MDRGDLAQNLQETEAPGELFNNPLAELEIVQIT